MGRNLLSRDREHDLEMPLDMRERLPPGHPCWRLLDTVEELDLSAFENSYRADGQGRAAYRPASLVALLLYCYSKSVSSRRSRLLTHPWARSAVKRGHVHDSRLRECSVAGKSSGA